jgi:hypothetical protein
MTYFAGREYLKAYKPRFLYIAFDETDDFAHAGLSLIVTCDHGGGNKIKEQWTDHGTNIEDAGQIWIAAIGPDTKATGLVKTNSPLYQKQIALHYSRSVRLSFHSGSWRI